MPSSLKLLKEETGTIAEFKMFPHHKMYHFLIYSFEIKKKILNKVIESCFLFWF